MAKEIKYNELDNYDGQNVLVTFNCADITFYGEEEYDNAVEALEKEHPNKLYRVNFKQQRFESLDGSCNIAFSHNLIGKIFECE